MNAITIPEIIIYNTLETIKKVLKDDIVENVADSKKSILYRMLGENSDGQPIRLNNYNYFEQAKRIFSKTQFLSVNFGYNFQVAKDLSLNIMLPAESSCDSSIGLGEGYITETETDSVGNEIKRETLTQMMESNYQIMISGDNSSEVSVVYNVLKSMLLILSPHLELLGLRLPKISGNDVMMQDDLIPVAVFHKVLNLSFKYELTVPKTVCDEVIKNFVFKGKMFEQVVI